MNYQENFAEIQRITNEIYEYWNLNKGAILTESDLQAYYYTKLCESTLYSGVTRIADMENFGTKVHLELKWFDKNEKLTIRPDISIIDSSYLLINSTNTYRLPKKEFAFTGNAILIELKLHRKKTIFGKSIVKGINKDLTNFKALIDRHPESIQVFEIIFDRYSGELNGRAVDQLFATSVNHKFHVFYRNQA